SNTYDEERTGYFNIGQLTTSTNANGKHEYDYEAAAKLAQKTTTVDGTSYVTRTTWDKSSVVLARRYSQYPENTPASETSVDEIGTAANPWTYNLAGLLKTIPGLITDITYQASGDTDLITYANGVSTDFTYDAQRKWLTSVLTTNTTTTLQDVSYTRALTGRIEAINGVTTG
ncbi:MAG: hypothetical protein GY743_19720, partial [Planctomycetaceae bacterium]|nr:hypothetical protein [Planctomycetaceae bacterium]